MPHRLLAATALALAVPASGQTADPADRQAAMFGARENVQQISLSPDGARIAVIAPVAGGTASVVMVGHTDGGPLAPRAPRERLP